MDDGAERGKCAKYTGMPCLAPSSVSLLIIPDAFRIPPRTSAYRCSLNRLSLALDPNRVLHFKCTIFWRRQFKKDFKTLQLNGTNLGELIMTQSTL